MSVCSGKIKMLLSEVITNKSERIMELVNPLGFVDARRTCAMTRYKKPNPYEQEMQKLKTELFLARHHIIELMPYEVEKILSSYHSHKSRKDGYIWIDETAKKIISHAEPISTEKKPGLDGRVFYFERRAYCPLCKRGSSAPYDSGFSLPEGLRRHLVGYGTVSQCVVMEAAKKLAQEYWDRLAEKKGPD
jgi:hypothetical protein